MEYLVAVDLEGIHGVVGEPYLGLLNTIPDYQVAVANAVKEINTVVKALFDGGATGVSVWDNHGGGNNIDFSLLDPRVERIDASKDRRRFDFVKAHDFKAILYLGYHAKEGTLNAVLAHTMSSVAIQYAKINGRAVGELDIDAYITAKYGIPSILAASDEKAVAQVHEISPEIETVITKYATGRNSAIFREEEDVLTDLYNATRKAMTKTGAAPLLPTPAHLEVRYTRMERAAEEYAKITGENAFLVEYGEDAHILHYTIHNVEDIAYVL